jgi:hypothetical protein
LLGSGLGAGPATTAPVAMLYWLPWQGQSMVPLLIWLTMHPIWVHTALNALNSLAAGWVTTTCSSVKILPPPTGISAVEASAFAAALVLALLALGLAAALAPLAPVGEAPVVAGAPVLAVGEELAVGDVLAAADVLAVADALLDELADAQADIAPARPTSPTPASTPRLVASPSVFGSCVTSAPFYMWPLVRNRGFPLPGPPPCSSSQGERRPTDDGSVDRLSRFRRAGSTNAL